MADTRREAVGGPAVLPETPEQARNVVLVGPAGSGKTTLLESLAAAAGAIGRRGSIADGNTIGDHDPTAIRQQRSVELSAATFTWKDAVVTVLDTPGYADYAGELRAGLRGADAALFVLSTVDGVDAATVRLWDECELVGLPRAIVVTNLDRHRADFDETVAVCQRVFSGGGGVLPLFLPIHGDDETVVGFIDLLDEQIWHWSHDGLDVTEAEDRHRELIESERDALIEGVVTESEDEQLMDAFFSGQPVAIDLLTKDLERAVARGHFHPVVGHAGGDAAVGAELILDLIVRAFPSPMERPLPMVTQIDGSPTAPIACDPAGPLVAEVIKTTSDPYVGKISVVRVFSGTLVADERVHVSGHFGPSSGHEDHDLDERAGHLMTLLGSQHLEVSSAPAGSIVAVGKLTRAETGDTLSDPSLPLLMEPWHMPEPLLPVAVVPHGSGDEDKLSTALARLVAEDPTLRIEHADDTGQLILWTLGEAHADLLLDRIRRRYGVEVDSVDLLPSLRATLADRSEGTGHLVRQSGGHGQYAVVQIEVEPLPRGQGFEFVDTVVGGAVPRNYIAAVQKGVQAQMEFGLAGGIPVVDLRVTLVDGKAHSVDSSDLAFQTAAEFALKDAASKTEVTLLEPILAVTIDIPEEHVGAVISDLSTRRGTVTGTESAGDGRSTVTANVPESEMSRYAIDIRSISHGTGSFSRRPAGLAPVPASIARRILAED